MTDQQNPGPNLQQTPQLTTLEGSPDLSNLTPSDLVAHQHPDTGRTVLFDAGSALTAERQPVNEAKDGGTERLDGTFVTKLGGQVVGESVSDENLRK